MPSQFFIITGLSGAGKSQTLKILEDFGFFCVDNLPVALLPKFADLSIELKRRWEHVAVGIDIRAGKASLASLESVLNQAKKKGVKYKILFFTANDQTLLQRYSETRRKHPVGKRVIDGIKKERYMLQWINYISDKEIDTSHLTLGSLKEILSSELNIVQKITVAVVSFGYKYGIPIDADLVFDVRFLPNPNYIPKLRYKNGRSPEVKRYINKQTPSKEFFKRFYRLLDFVMPHYIKEGKSYITAAIGCTGGKHRSVMVAEALAKHFKSKKFPVHIYHRDLERVSIKV